MRPCPRGAELTGSNFSLNATRKASQLAKGVLPSARDSMWGRAHTAASLAMKERAKGTILCTSSRMAPLAPCTFFPCGSQSANQSSFTLIQMQKALLNSQADSESLPLKTTGFSTIDREPEADGLALTLFAWAFTRAWTETVSALIDVAILPIRFIKSWAEMLTTGAAELPGAGVW
jgi:hypothetical protein